MFIDFFLDLLPFVDPLGKELDEFKDLDPGYPLLDDVRHRVSISSGLLECVLWFFEWVFLGDEDMKGLLIVQHVPEDDLIAID